MPNLIFGAKLLLFFDICNNLYMLYNIKTCFCVIFLHIWDFFSPFAGGKRVESGKWKVESGKWKVESGKWKVESGEWKVNRYIIC